MTTRGDEKKLREVADHHAADHPVVAAQLYADADYLAQLPKAATTINGDEAADDQSEDRPTPTNTDQQDHK